MLIFREEPELSPAFFGILAISAKTVQQHIRLTEILEQPLTEPAEMSSAKRDTN